MSFTRNSVVRRLSGRLPRRQAELPWAWPCALSVLVIGLSWWMPHVSTGRTEQSVVVVLDDSGSMADRMRSNRRVRKITAAKEALLTVLQQLPSDARVGIVLLNGTRNGDPWVVPLGPVDFDQARATIEPIRADGGTPLGQFIKVGADALLRSRDEVHYGEYRLLVVTDGEATDPELVNRYLPDVLSRGLSVDVIGVDMSGEHSLATRVHTYRRADDPASLVAAVQEVFAETTSDSSDSGESSFELLAGIPTEVAASALRALGEAGNEPIGEGAAGDENGVDSDWQRTSPQGQPVKRSGRWFIIVGVVVVILLVQVMKAIHRANRR